MQQISSAIKLALLRDPSLPSQTASQRNITSVEALRLGRSVALGRGRRTTNVRWSDGKS